MAYGDVAVGDMWPRVARLLQELSILLLVCYKRAQFHSSIFFRR